MFPQNYSLAFERVTQTYSIEEIVMILVERVIEFPSFHIWRNSWKLKFASKLSNDSKEKLMKPKRHEKRDNLRSSDIFQNILELEGAILEEKDVMLINGHLSSR